MNIISRIRTKDITTRQTRELEKSLGRAATDADQNGGNDDNAATVTETTPALTGRQLFMARSANGGQLPPSHPSLRGRQLFAARQANGGRAPGEVDEK